MANVTGKLSTVLNFGQTNTAGLPGSGAAVAIQQNWQLNVTTSGDAADNTDLKYTATLSFAASPQTLDLTALLDIYGGTVNFKRVRSFAVRVNSTTDTQTLVIGNAASNAWTGFLGATHLLTIQASTATNHGFFVITAPNTTGMVVSAGSKSVKLDPGASTFTADIEITGCVA